MYMYISDIYVLHRLLVLYSTKNYRKHIFVDSKVTNLHLLYHLM